MMNCAHCGKKFKPNTARKGGKAQRFCSNTCYERQRRLTEPIEKKQRRLKSSAEWRSKHPDKLKAYRAHDLTRDSYIIHLLCKQGKEPTPENIAYKKKMLFFKRKMRAENKRRRNRNF